MEPSSLITAFTVNACIITLVVFIYYEWLRLLNIVVPKLTNKHRLKLLYYVFGILLGHIIEIWLFAFGFIISIQTFHLGHVGGLGQMDLMDYAYYSATIYTSLGFGDLIPKGSVRLLTSMETLTGLTLITWSASFIYLEMQKHWKKSPAEEGLEDISEDISIQ